MVSKRNVSPSGPQQIKKIKKETNDGELLDDGKEAFHRRFKHLINVQNEFYPAEMSMMRAVDYSNEKIPKPFTVFEKTLEDTKEKTDEITHGDCVVHWFKNDLRVSDNHALSKAFDYAKSKSIPLITIYILSPQDWKAHLTSPARVNFTLRSLDHLKSNLDVLNIPLYIETVEKRRDIPSRLIEFAQKWNSNHIFANAEYEVDELRRDTKMIKSCLDLKIHFNCLHDTCIVPPGELVTGQGKQYSVFTPWYKKWVQWVTDNSELIDLFEAPGPNSEESRSKYDELFKNEVPSAPSGKELSQKDEDYYNKHWRAGETEGLEHLSVFLDKKIKNYSQRDFPYLDATSKLSVYFASGVLSSRTAVNRAKSLNKGAPINSGNTSISSWIREVAWRDFYRHVMVNWPYTVMNKPFQLERSDLRWEYNTSHFQAWCEGKTGFPIVDAGMRQLVQTGYMHNRVRMIVASFLTKDLLIDWRFGESFFMLNLIDGDFASNNGGWGWASSVGVDPQPYFRIFNPLLQSERFDKEGSYIRKFVPELRDIKGKAIHDPYGRGCDESTTNGYPKPIVDHKTCRERALERFKETTQ